jgi:beta-phosphoglucomutase-like phosphatase (HAD superfamily)
VTTSELSADYPPLRGLLFDFDGTLVDSELELHLPAFNQAFSDTALPWRWGIPLYTRLLEVPGGRERIRAYADQHCPQMSVAQRDTLAGQVHAAKNIRVQQRLTERPLRLRPGIAGLLGEAGRAGLRLGIASTASFSTIESAMNGALGRSVWEVFDAIIGSDQVARGKPQPDVYLRALTELGLSTVETIAIEDSQVGLAAARAAGLVTVVAHNALTCDQNFEGAALVLESLGPPGNAAPPSAPAQPQESSTLDLEHLAALLRQGVSPAPVSGFPTT